MAYKVKELAELSGVTVRTLHYYDEISLLKPSYQASNNYRLYEEKELLKLQQILFFRELGMALSEIKKIFADGKFQELQSLKSHRDILQKEIDRKNKLIETIDKTINYLGGKLDMSHSELYYGFESERQKFYEQYLISENIASKEEIEASKEKVKDWSDQDKMDHKDEGEFINRTLSELIGKGVGADSEEVQQLVDRHYKWVCNFWIPGKADYINLGKMYNENTEFKRFYGEFHPELASFLANSMKLYADRIL